MHLLVLPISGGGFVSQLAIIQHLCEINYEPNVTMASSGGNVAAYIASAARWKWPDIERVARKISHEYFISPWSQLSAIHICMGYFKGYMHNKGSGIYNFLKEHFSEDTIQRDEIWTGTYNKTQKKACLFCNKSKDTSILDSSFIDHELNRSMPPIYTNGDIDLIGKYSIASASIPAFVPEQKICGEEYADGGICGSSPVSIMKDPILAYVKLHNSPLHIIYVNSLDLSNPETLQCNNVFDKWKEAALDLTRSQTVNDRLSAYELLRSYPGNINKSDFPCTYDNLQRMLKIQSLISYSLLEIFPKSNTEIDISNFNGDDVVAGIKTAYNNCHCRLWWISDDQVCNDGICDLIVICQSK